MRDASGIDTVKVAHWAVADDPEGRVVPDRALGNDQGAIDVPVAELRTLGPEVVIGESFGRFPQAVLLAGGFALVPTQGIAVNRAGHGVPGGERKSDPRDARTIAGQVRTRDLHPILRDDDTLVALRLEVGRRRDLMQDQTRRISRLRGLLCSIYSGLQRTLDLICNVPRALRSRYVTPAEIQRAGQSRLLARRGKTPYLHGTGALVGRASEAARVQKAIVPGKAPTAEPIRDLAAGAREARRRIGRIERDREALLADHPDGVLIRPLPEMRAVLAAGVIVCGGDILRCGSAGALTAAAGLAPVRRHSGTRAAWRRAFGGDTALRHAVDQGAFCAVTTGARL